jgi:hypothetical protein
MVHEVGEGPADVRPDAVSRAPDRVRPAAGALAAAHYDDPATVLMDNRGMVLLCRRGRAAQVAVVGSIVRFTRVILLAGKPDSSACLRISASSLAR